MGSSLLPQADLLLGIVCNVLGVVGGILGLCGWLQSRKNRRPVVKLNHYAFYKGMGILGFRIENPLRKPVRIDTVGLYDAKAPKRDRLVVAVRLGKAVYDGAPVALRTEPLALQEKVARARELRAYCRTEKGQLVLGAFVNLDELRSACEDSVREHSARQSFFAN